MADNKTPEYSARDDYVADHVVDNYIEDRFSSLLGRHRFRKERAAISRVLDRIDASRVEKVLDIPTGIGRWLPVLGRLAPQEIVAGDVSKTMLARANGTPRSSDISYEFLETIAEDLPFDDHSFDLVFCHALMKHLPKRSQEQVISELCRVSRKYVVVTVSINQGIAKMLRPLRKAKHAVVVQTEWVRDHAEANGFDVTASQKASTLIGFERVYLLESQHSRK